MFQMFTCLQPGRDFKVLRQRTMYRTTGGTQLMKIAQPAEQPQWEESLTWGYIWDTGYRAHARGWQGARQLEECYTQL